MTAQPPPAHPSLMIAETKTAPQDAADAPLPEPLFRTKRLLARPMHPQDATSVQRACEPASITKYMTLAFAHPYTMEQAVKWIESNRDAPKNHLYLTTHEDPYTVIGGIGLKPGGDIESHTGEVGYWLAETHWGSGLITEALEGFVSYTFLERDGDGSAPVEGKPAEVKKTRIFATVVNGNTASMRILEKCGFKKEGVQKEHVRIRNGTLCDVHMYGLTRGDWDEWRRERGS